MQLSYKLDKSRTDFKVIYPQNGCYLKPYYQTLVYNLVYFFTQKTSFGLIASGSNSNFNIEIHLPTHEKIYITIKDDIVIVNLYQKCFTFNHLYESNDQVLLILKSVLFYSMSKEIIEDFNSHQVSFKVRPNDVNKYYELIVPLTTYEIIDPTPLLAINSKTTLNDLHKLYNTYFLKYQSPYDYEENPTILSIKELSEDSMTFDSIHLKKGKPVYYEFNKNKDGIDIRISYNEVANSPLVTVLGLTSTSPFDIDFEIRAMLKKAENIMWHENIKLIKDKK